jgi:phosphate uptake regulator
MLRGRSLERIGSRRVRISERVCSPCCGKVSDGIAYFELSVTYSS